MKPELAALVQVLDDETALCRDLVRELQADQTRVLQQDIAGLEASTARKEERVLKLQLLEQARGPISETLGRNLDLAPEQICVSSLCERLGSEGIVLEQAAERLRAVLAGLRELVTVGRGFLEQSIVGIRGLLALIQSLRAPETAHTYDGSGQIAAAQSAPPVAVRREV
ncbi:MAG: flagellar protein FlgN [Myxococcota bacterium]